MCVRFGSGALVLLAAAALAQRFQFEHEEGPRPTFPSDAEFHFVRLEYTDLPQYHRRWGYASRDGRGEGWWIVDWPDAEDHFSVGVRRLTRIHTGDPTISGSPTTASLITPGSTRRRPAGGV